MDGEGLDAFILSSWASIYYFTGTSAADYLIIPDTDEPVLLGSRYGVHLARYQAPGIKSVVHDPRSFKEAIRESGARRIGFDQLPHQNHLAVEGMGITPVQAEGLVWALRSVKDAEEQRLTREAVRISDRGMEAVREAIKPGVSENTVAAAAMRCMLEEGAWWTAFPMTVASGPRSGFVIGRVTDRKIRRDDLVIVDMGAMVEGYTSDVTRTFIVGEPSDEQRTIYETVMRANLEAFPNYVNGAYAPDVDAVARGAISEAGYGSRFCHSLGHGMGIENHESPWINEASIDTLRSGNILSVEPGVYVPGWGGVRIEDAVLITDEGPERLTQYPKDIDAVTV